MRDEFLRHLRPMPRAAFVHELKARLDRLPRTRPLVGGPAYLRTLLTALLIGGAAFAVTMMARRDPLTTHSDAPVAQAQRLPARVDEVAPAPSLTQSKEDELTPVTAHAVRRDPAPIVIEVAGAPHGLQAGRVSATNGAARAEPFAPAQAVSGIAVAGLGVGSIEGLGVSFPSPIYTAWSLQYRRLTGVSVSYEALRSGDGVKMLQNYGFAFTAVDVPLRAEALNVNRLMQFPVLANGVVPVTHLAGIPSSEIILDGPTLARIYLGEIALWSDPQIRRLNPKLRLPDTRITLVYRADSSVTTYLFTEYLARSAPWFRSRHGVSMQLDLSPGAAARGNDGMMDLIERTDGAIGYVDYLYARQKAIDSVRLRNKDGNAVMATPESLQSAAAHADWGAPTLGPSLADLPGEKTWPITGATFVVVQIHANRAATSTALQFFDWAYRNGSKQAEELDYVTLPASVVKQVWATWAATYGGGTPADYARK